MISNTAVLVGKMETNKDQEHSLREKNFQELMKEIEKLDIVSQTSLEDIEAFSLSDIPEIPSALERSQDRPSTPFPSESIAASLESTLRKPWKITSGTPRLTFDDKSESIENLALPIDDNESWVRVDITENSTLRVAAGHGDVPYPSNPTPRPPLPPPPPADSTSRFVYLSIEELMNQTKSREESKKVVGALKNQDTGSLHPLQLLEEDKQEISKVEQQQIENIPWCSFYLLIKVLGLMLLTAGIILLVILSLPDDNDNRREMTELLRPEVKTTFATTTEVLYFCVNTLFIITKFRL